MNKNLVIVAVIALLVVGGGIAASQMNSDEKSSENSSMTNKSDSTKTADSKNTQNNQVDEVDSMSAHGTYITLADFESSPDMYKTTRNVHFFHATWCPSCQASHKELTSDDSKIPANVTIIKTDFDDETDLRKKYGVTTQHTFVEVDMDGNEVNQWSVPSIDDLYAEL